MASDLIPARWIGHSILEERVRTRYNISILAIKRDRKLYPMPHPDYVFGEGETMMVMGTHEDLKALTR